MKTKSRLTSGQTMIFIAGALFCLMLISVSLLSGLYAKFLSTGNGDDTARVAKFDVATTVHNVDAKFINMVPTVNEYTISVTNNSEVAVRCDLVLVFDTPVQNFLGVKVVVGENEFSPELTNDYTLTFRGISALAPNGDSASCSLVFAVTDWNAVTSEATGENVEFNFEFDGTLYCTQID